MKSPLLLAGISEIALSWENWKIGGRAWRRIMTPLSCLEVDSFDLGRVMISGLLPPHFLSSDPLEDMRAYVADYLKEEIAAEALVKNIPADDFGRKVLSF